MEPLGFEKGAGTPLFLWDEPDLPPCHAELVEAGLQFRGMLAALRQAQGDTEKAQGDIQKAQGDTQSAR